MGAKMTLKEWLKDFLYTLKINEVKLNYTKDLIIKIYERLDDIEEHLGLTNKEIKDESNSNE